LVAKQGYCINGQHGHFDVKQGYCINGQHGHFDVNRHVLDQWDSCHLRGVPQLPGHDGFAFITGGYQ
jgi:hypothetical protein